MGERVPMMKLIQVMTDHQRRNRLRLSSSSRGQVDACYPDTVRHVSAEQPKCGDGHDELLDGEEVLDPVFVGWMKQDGGSINHKRKKHSRIGPVTCADIGSVFLKSVQLCPNTERKQTAKGQVISCPRPLPGRCRFEVLVGPSRVFYCYAVLVD
jgi:hypothetical protein